MPVKGQPVPLQAHPSWRDASSWRYMFGSDSGAATAKQFENLRAPSTLGRTTVPCSDPTILSRRSKRRSPRRPVRRTCQYHAAFSCRDAVRPQVKDRMASFVPFLVHMCVNTRWQRATGSCVHLLQLAELAAMGANDSYRRHGGPFFLASPSHTHTHRHAPRPYVGRRRVGRR